MKSESQPKAIYSSKAQHAADAPITKALKMFFQKQKLELNTSSMQKRKSSYH